MKISVIVSTYNAEEWLEKVLLGYMSQTHPEYEVIVADDGSRATTKDLIDGYAAKFPVPLRHLWHEDDGYRRQEILNKAIPLADAPYILFTDGDCIPRADFVAVHAQQAERGRFLSGGYCKLSMKLSKQIAPDDIASGRAFDLDWMKQQDNLGFSNTLKLGASDFTGRFLDAITTAKPTFNNCNSSAWKDDLLAINGYDERMKYGGPDRELGERLENYGVRGKQIRHRAVCVHLDHARGYKTKESVDRNLAIRAETRASKIVVTPYGINKPDSPQG
ncbi:MAG TPA: glycosyltransferase family 2 protein [Lysobacter sp.]|nr:glycosyltransferase family 2 protein [Lysobacter sp.]